MNILFSVRSCQLTIFLDGVDFCGQISLKSLLDNIGGFIEQWIEFDRFAVRLNPCWL